MKNKPFYLKALVVLIIALLLTVTVHVSAAESATSTEDLRIAYCNLSFENDTHLMYAIKSNDENVKLLVWSEPQSEYLLGTQKAMVEPLEEQMTIESDLYTVFKYTGLAAKQMTDDVYVRACIDNGGGDVTYGEVHKYSILQYAYNKLGKTGVATSNEKLINMLTDMLQYGASAQEYHGYKTDRLATADFVQIKLTDGALPDGFKYGLYLEGEKVTITAPETNSDGDIISNWQDKNGNSIATTPEYELTVGTKNATYTPIYEQPVTYSQGLEFTSNGNGTCSVSGIGTCTDTDIKIPPTSPDGDIVTSISSNAFNGCTSLKSITIPNSVESIDGLAFYGCTSLESITIAEGNTIYRSEGNCLIEIASQTLIAGCKNSMIPDSVESIGDYAFSGCKSLESITIPNSVEIIDMDAFIGCTSLKSVTFEEGSKLTSIGSSAFYSCKSLESIEIPSSVKSIGYYAFEKCTSLEKIIVEEGNTIYRSEGNCLIEIANKTLIAGCKNSVIPDSIEIIGELAFSGCTSLESIEIPSSVTSIGHYAFEECTSLESIEIPNSVTSIGYYAFSGCTSLESITILNSVESIGYRAFSGCTGLKSVTFEAGSKLTSIDSSAFSGCESLESIEIPSSVESIGKDAFYSCTSLKSVTFEEGSKLTSIGYRAFYGCTDLKSVTFEEGSKLTSIGEYAFSGCTSLESITILNSVESIGTNAFSGCTGLKSVTFEEDSKLTSIDSSAFFVCTSLESITIPNSVEIIDRDAFGGCTSLESITIPNSVEIIDRDAFSGCTSLKNVTFEEGSKLTSIGKSAFSGCTSLKSITIPNSVTSIGDYAFYGCTGLTINAEAESQPSGWATFWNNSNCPVNWGYKGE